MRGKSSDKNLEGEIYRTSYLTLCRNFQRMGIDSPGVSYCEVCLEVLWFLPGLNCWQNTSLASQALLLWHLWTTGHIKAPLTWNCSIKEAMLGLLDPPMPTEGLTGKKKNMTRASMVSLCRVGPNFPFQPCSSSQSIRVMNLVSKERLSGLGWSLYWLFFMRIGLIFSLPWYSLNILISHKSSSHLIPDSQPCPWVFLGAALAWNFVMFPVLYCSNLYSHATHPFRLS